MCAVEIIFLSDKKFIKIDYSTRHESFFCEVIFVDIIHHTNSPLPPHKLYK